MYGFTDMALATKLLEAHLRGVEVQILLDMSQERGPKEIVLVHWLMCNGFPPDHIVITTSDEHQIMHEKTTVVDSVRLSFGSLNWSETGFRQENSLVIVEDAVLGAVKAAEHTRMRLWALNTEPQYQKYVA